jgi:hypothetical protein
MQLLRTTVAALAVTALVMTLGGSANAQSTKVENPFRVKVGAFFPVDSDTQDALGSNFISFGLGYDFRQVYTFRPTTLGFYADGFHRTRSTSAARSESTVLSLGLESRFALWNEPPSRDFNPYAGAGIGVYYTRFKQELSTGPVQSATRTSVGGKFFIGTEAWGNWLAEAQFDFVPHPSVFGEDQDLNGWQLRLGYRF